MGTARGTIYSTGWMYHDLALGRAGRLAIAGLFGLMLFTVAIMTSYVSSYSLVPVLMVLLIGLVAALVLALTHVPRDAQTRWEHNYSTRVRDDVEPFRSRAEDALRKAGIWWSAVPKPAVTGYCEGSDYVLWFQPGVVGLRIQKIAPWKLLRLILGPKTDATADLVENVRRVLSEEFDIPSAPESPD